MKLNLLTTILTLIFSIPTFCQVDYRLNGCWSIIKMGNWSDKYYDEYFKFLQNDSCVFESVTTMENRKIDNVTKKTWIELEYIHEKEIGEYYRLNDSTFVRNYFTYKGEMFGLKELPKITCDTLFLIDKVENLDYHKFINELTPVYKKYMETDTIIYKIQSDTLFTRRLHWKRKIEYKKIL